MRMSDAPTPRLSKEQIEDLRRRRSEAADVLAQTLLDMWKAEQRAKRRGVPWPPPAEVPTAPPEVPRTRARRGPDKPLQRVFREYQRDDADTVKAILDTTWFPASELESEPEGGQRYRVVLNLGRTRAGVAVLDTHGELAVLRAIAVRLSHRRERHGSALGAFMIQIAHELGVARLYAAAATTGFLDALGFEPCERALLPAAASALPGIAEAPAAALIFELVPSGHVHRESPAPKEPSRPVVKRPPKRMSRKQAAESALAFLAMLTDPKTGRPARTTGPSAEQKRQDHAEGEDHERR